jgi:hypothetical protein
MPIEIAMGTTRPKKLIFFPIGMLVAGLALFHDGYKRLVNSLCSSQFIKNIIFYFKSSSLNLLWASLYVEQPS